MRVKKWKIRNKMKILLALITLASLLLAVAVPALAAQKISNAGNFGKVDGISEDPKIGEHNSYAWCSELFPQTNGDYLWVGMNRDMGRAIFDGATVGNPIGSFSAGVLASLAGLPSKSDDQVGKIYRQKAADDDEKWELVYENPAINGYRRMIMFKGSLYVMAGLTNMPKYDYSIVLRFKPDFKKGDKPDIVFWEKIPEINANMDPNGPVYIRPEYFRSACILDNKLYIGTFDNKIYTTDGESLANLTPNQGAKSTGWTLFSNLAQDPMFEDNNGNPYASLPGIWDMLGFNGSLYAFVTNGGFTVYKLTPKSNGGYDITQTVGGKSSARYPHGMGIPGNIAASPYRSVSFGKDYVYVSTFASGPFILGSFVLGDVGTAFNDVFCPGQIYRFDANDNWEVVVGDTSGKYVAKDKAGKAVPVVGNQRAGFYTGFNFQENTSFNQYVWWMTEYKGKLYASTWDLGVFRHKTELLLLTIMFSGVAGGIAAGGGVLSALNSVINIFGSLSLGMSAMQTELAAQTIGNAMEAAYVSGVNNPKTQGLLETLLAPLTASEGSSGLIGAILDFLKSLTSPSDPEPEPAAAEDPGSDDSKPLSLIRSLPTLLKYADGSNPPGFDLFVSDDGKNFSPVTTNGFGYEENFGGRVLLPTDYGLFVCTANPFGGGQVWRADDMKQEIQPNIPATIRLNVGETFRASVRSLALTSGATVQMTASASNCAQVSLSKRGAERSIIDTEITVKRNLLRRYNETHKNKNYPAQMYDVAFTGKAAGEQTITLRFYWNNVEVTKTVKVIVGGTAPAQAQLPGNFTPVQTQGGAAQSYNGTSAAQGAQAAEQQSIFAEVPTAQLGAVSWTETALRQAEKSPWLYICMSLSILIIGFSIMALLLMYEKRYMRAKVK